jgi:hypothetical protein
LVGILPLGVLALVHVGLVLGALAVMVLYFGNRIAMEFTVDERGVFSQVRDRKAHRASQLAVVLGLATGRFTVAGAGMLARSSASSFVPWKAVQRVRCDETRHTIHLEGGWRTRAALFCTPQNYPGTQLGLAHVPQCMKTRVFLLLLGAVLVLWGEGFPMVLWLGAEAPGTVA